LKTIIPSRFLRVGERGIIDVGNNNNTYRRLRRRRAAAITTAPNIKRESVGLSTQNKLKRNNGRGIRTKLRR